MKKEGRGRIVQLDWLHTSLKRATGIIASYIHATTYSCIYNTYSNPTSPGIDPSNILGRGAKGRAWLILSSFSAFKAVEDLTGALEGANAAAEARRDAQITDFIVVLYCCCGVCACV